MTECPLCGGPSRPRYVATDRNWGVSEERFEYRLCQRCRALFLANVPGDLGRYYPSGYYRAGPAPTPSPTERAKLDLVLRHAARGHLIEVGPGSGSFAAQAVAAGFRVTVIDRDQDACRRLSQTLGVQAVCSDDPARALSEAGAAQVIALWHALEHLGHPWGVVDRAAAAVEPGGCLVIATPNPDSLQLRLLGSRWAHLDAPRHRFLLPLPALRDRAGRAGLTLVELELADRTGRDWNAFGWQRALTRRGGPGPVASKLGSALALALAPLERHRTLGSTYTAMFRKQPGPR